jgi:hypothetical protein
MDRANELFHEIVVEKSREIYENLISEEEDEEEMDESADEEEMDESADEEEMDEGQEELEDSYMMDADDEEGDDMGGEIGGDATDDMLGDIEADDQGGEGGEDQAIFDIKNAIAELEAAFADLEAAQGGEAAHDDMGGEFGDEEGGEFGDEEDETGEMMGMVREYRESVPSGHGAEKKGAAEGGIAGANTGEKMPGAGATKSPISSGSGKPTSGANAKNIAAGGQGAGSNTGTSPSKHMKGINPESGEKFAKGIHNVDGAKSGVKTLSKVTDGHGAEKRGGGEGRAVGAGTGENSVKGATHTTSLLKKL